MTEFEFWERWGLGLDNKQFANAFIALGVLAAAYGEIKAPADKVKNSLQDDFEQKIFETSLKAALVSPLSKSRATKFRVTWTFPKRDQVVKVGSDTIYLSNLDPQMLADSWTTTVNSVDDIKPRFRITWYPPKEQVKTWFRLLIEADPDNKAVYIDLDAPHASLHIKSPLRLGYLPGNVAKKITESTVSFWPSNKLARSIRIDRDNANCDILVFNGRNSQLLTSILDLPVPHKCNLLIVRGLLEDNTDMMSYLLSAISANCYANGFVFLHPETDNENMIQALNRFIENLSHNQPLDIAISHAFSNQFSTDPTIFLSLKIAEYQIEHLVEQTCSRIKASPPNSRIKIDPAVYDQLNMPRPERKEESYDIKNLEKNITKHKSEITYVSESTGASGITEINKALDRAKEPKEAEQKRSQRYLKSWILIKKNNKFQEEKNNLFIGVPTLIRVGIHPPDDTGISLSAPFPDEQLPEGYEEWNLTVVLTEPNHLERPLRKKIKLPKDGPSSICEFGFVPIKHPFFEGRITVLHRGRILQTAVLKAAIVDKNSLSPNNTKIEISELIPVRSHIGDLEERRQYDISFVFNHTTDNRPRLTAISADHAWITDITSYMKVAEGINDVISKVGMSVADYSGGLHSQENVELLIELAQHGWELYAYIVADQIKDPSNRAEFANKEYIQIVSTKAEALLPLEFIYDVIAPDKEAKLCPKWSEAVSEKNMEERTRRANELLTGKCHEEERDQQKENKEKTNGKERRCKYRTTKYVCPLGFWGVNKVIERHVFTPALTQPGKEFFLQSEPTKTRSSLDISGTAIVAASEKVKPPMLAPVRAACTQHLGSPPQVAKDWDQWVKFIEEFKPKVLLAMPHTDGDKTKSTLEIGGKAIKSNQITEAHVHPEKEKIYPLVMLLGCDTVGTALEYGSHVSWFRRGGAAIVISTIAKVFGGHAARVAEQFINGLKQFQTKPERIGEIIRAIKRQALLDGMLMSLCIVAFGDADWKLNGEEE